jgi:hypothetical protein
MEGDLVVLFTRTEEHLGPDGAILLSRSTDNGTSWLRPVVVLDSPLDDRESGITTLRDGRIVPFLTINEDRAPMTDMFYFLAGDYFLD